MIDRTDGRTERPFDRKYRAYVQIARVKPVQYYKQLEQYFQHLQSPKCQVSLFNCKVLLKHWNSVQRYNKYQFRVINQPSNLSRKRISTDGMTRSWTWLDRDVKTNLLLCIPPHIVTLPPSTAAKPSPPIGSSVNVANCSPIHQNVAMSSTSGKQWIYFS